MSGDDEVWADENQPTRSPSSRSPADRRPSGHVWHPSSQGRPRQHDHTKHQGRPVPSLPTKPFNWRDHQ